MTQYRRCAKCRQRFVVPPQKHCHMCGGTPITVKPKAPTDTPSAVVQWPLYGIPPLATPAGRRIAALPWRKHGVMGLCLGFPMGLLLVVAPRYQEAGHGVEWRLCDWERDDITVYDSHQKHSTLALAVDRGLHEIRGRIKADPLVKTRKLVSHDWEMRA